jgi:GntR family transcriptional regulator of vanillate catabolism
MATLRQLIVSGQLPAGERVAEIPLAQRLGVSRTPVRLAFRSLEREGLLTRAGKRGYVVRRFSDADVRTAIEVRGLLEGPQVQHPCAPSPRCYAAKAPVYQLLAAPGPSFCAFPCSGMFSNDV